MPFPWMLWGRSEEIIWIHGDDEGMDSLLFLPCMCCFERSLAVMISMYFLNVVDATFMSYSVAAPQCISSCA